MPFASALLVLAGSPQTFVGITTAQDSLSLFVNVMSVYGRHVSSEVGRRLAQFSCKLTNTSKRFNARRRLSDFSAKRRHQATTRLAAMISLERSRRVV
jgi:hypothetical protein